MDLIKKFISVLFILLLTFSNSLVVYAENNISVADASSGTFETLETFANYALANKYFNNNKEKYDNLVILKDDDIVKMEYGIARIATSDKSCKLNSEYSSKVNGEGYTNGCYGQDSAYLSSDEKTVTFKISGDIGTINQEEVKLIPYEMLESRLSLYVNHNGVLHHEIKTDLSNDFYIYDLEIDDAPYYLKEDKYYYSYDGNYFYEDFKLMIDDYRNDKFENSINFNEPYYNYYQYLPHRSYTNYNLEEIEDYFSNVLHIDGKIQFYDDLNLDNANDDVNLSQLHDELKYFFGYENIYGANAMMMLALACNESAYGKSFFAFSKNNLFGHAAYDSDPERNASRYKDIESSIYSHARYYISRSYSGVHSSLYHGSFFGNKGSGMNVAYSSSPYWGEKNASNYYLFDKDLGFKDKNSYALGIIHNSNFVVYADQNLSKTLNRIKGLNNYSVIILEDLGDVYKIQGDASYDTSYEYNPEKQVGYIKKSLVDYVVNEENINDKEYDTYTYDLNGGSIEYIEDEIEIKVLEGKTPIIPIPKKMANEFVGFDDNGVAQYKEVKSIEVVSDFNKLIEKNYFYNLKGGELRVNYEDGTSKTLPINSNMIFYYNSDDEGESNIEIIYDGLVIDYPVEFSSEISEIRSVIESLIEKNIASYKENGTFNEEELAYIKNNLYKVDYQTSFNDIRYIDKMLLEESHKTVNYNFKDSKYDISISGLALSLEKPKQLDILKPFKDTYYIEASTINDEAYNKLESVADAYDFEVVDSLNVSVKYNLAKANFNNPIVFGVKVNDKKQDKIYTVYHLDENGNVIKCMTTQTKNYVSFMTRSEGDFMILCKDSFNVYDFEDRVENMSIYNSDPDNHLLFIEGSILLTIGLIGFILIIVYNIFEKKKEKLWNDYRKSLLEVASPQEEKLKN